MVYLCIINDSKNRFLTDSLLRYCDAGPYGGYRDTVAKLYSSSSLTVLRLPSERGTIVTSLPFYSWQYPCLSIILLLTQNGVPSYSKPMRYHVFRFPINCCKGVCRGPERRGSLGLRFSINCCIIVYINNEVNFAEKSTGQEASEISRKFTKITLIMSGGFQ